MSTTFQDMIDHLVDYLGGTPTDAVQRDCKRAVLEAYRDLANAYRWTYLLTQGRLFLNPPYATGTIAYTQSTREAEIAGGTWPSWTINSYLRVGTVAGKVVKLSGAFATLDPSLNLGADVAAGTPFQLYRDTYLLPDDYIANDQALYESNFGGMTYIHPREWLLQERFIYGEGTPRCYTITGDSAYPGRMVLRLSPHPSEAKTVDYLYHRRPRRLGLVLANAGTASIASGDTNLTGLGSSFTPQMVGSMIRLSGSVASPTSVLGKNPAAFEARISGWSDATTITLADPAPATLSGVAYAVSDPIDLEEGAMLNAYLRCCEMHIAMNRTLKDKPSASAQYTSALNSARAADSRSFAGRAVGEGGPYRQRLRDMPISFADTAN